MKILFMCVANSARSQMAEGIARKIFADKAEVESAGSSPGKLNPTAVKVMAEVGIDISRHYSKDTDRLSPKFLANLDYVITLCAEEVCPSVVSSGARLHWPVTDPAGREGGEDEQLSYFRSARDLIQSKIEALRHQVK